MCVSVCMFVCTCVHVYVYACLHIPTTTRPSRLFAFPEHQVHEAADERHGEADPGQDVGGAVGSVLKTVHVKGVLLSRVDGCSNHHAQSWRKMGINQDR